MPPDGSLPPDGPLGLPPDGPLSLPPDGPLGLPPDGQPYGPPDQSPDEQLERALALAFRELNRRERTCREMREHLVRRGIEARVVEDALRELTAQGYLDDARFARMFAQDKRTLEQWGAERIRRGLLAKGVERELVAAVLADEPSGAEGDELERARALLRRRFPDGSQTHRERERALAVLLRKGYEYELAVEALGALAQE